MPAAPCDTASAAERENYALTRAGAGAGAHICTEKTSNAPHGGNGHCRWDGIFKGVVTLSNRARNNSQARDASSCSNGRAPRVQRRRPEGPIQYVRDLITTRQSCCFADAPRRAPTRKDKKLRHREIRNTRPASSAAVAGRLSSVPTCV